MGRSGITYACIYRALKRDKTLARDMANWLNDQLAELRGRCLCLDGYIPCPKQLPKSQFPYHLLNAIVCLIPKTDPPSSKMSEWRPVILMENLLKGWSKILREYVVGFLTSPDPSGKSRYLMDGYLLHTLAKGGSAQMAL